MPLFGEKSDSDVLAHVRYVDFKQRESGRQTLFSAPKLQRKFVSGPSGHQYQFRQQGRASSPQSQWLLVRDKRDVDYFRDRTGFEVKRA